MLTKEAWNALLKTLEEPPKHVIFILATTEIEKVPETIISRCQVFTFKKPTTVVLRELIERVVKNEKWKIAPAGVELIAMLGDGSFRDTHGILQKVMSYSKDKNITLEEIESVTGAPSGILVNDFVESIALGNIEQGLGAIGKAGAQNIDMDVYLRLILGKMRTALLLRYAPEMKGEISESLTDDDKAFMVKILKEKGGHLNSKTLEILLETLGTMKYASIKELPLELALIKILG